MDGCGEAGEAQGILQGSFDENFSATSWESCATSSQLRSNFVTSMVLLTGGPPAFFSGKNDDLWQTSVNFDGFCDFGVKNGTTWAIGDPMGPNGTIIFQKSL